MWNILEQPWTGLVIAAILWNILAVVRWFVPLKWPARWLPPVIVAVVALGLWYFVQTDREKINAVINTVVSAAKDGEPDRVEGVLGANYSDSYHPGKTEFMNSCRRWLNNYNIAAAAVTDRHIDIRNGRADIVIEGSIRVEDVGEFGVIVVPGKIQLRMEKRGRDWFITSAELLEYFGRPSSWRSIRY